MKLDGLGWGGHISRGTGKKWIKLLLELKKADVYLIRVKLKIRK